MTTTLDAVLTAKGLTREGPTAKFVEHAVKNSFFHVYPTFSMVRMERPPNAAPNGMIVCMQGLKQKMSVPDVQGMVIATAELLADHPELTTPRQLSASARGLAGVYFETRTPSADVEASFSKLAKVAFSKVLGLDDKRDSIEKREAILQSMVNLPVLPESRKHLEKEFKAFQARRFPFNR